MCANRKYCNIFCTQEAFTDGIANISIELESHHQIIGLQTEPSKELSNLLPFSDEIVIGIYLLHTFYA